MGRYLLKRILFFIPTLIIISLLAFIISINAPGDPLDRMVSAQESGGEFSTQTANTAKEKERWRKKLGLDLPVFYVSLSNAATPDTLYKVYDDNERTALKRLISQYGNWENIAAWNNQLHTLSTAINMMIPDTSNFAVYGKNVVLDTIIEAKQNIGILMYSYENAQIQLRLNTLTHYAATYPYFAPIKEQILKTKTLYEQLTSEKQLAKTW
ncbi:MAG: hypothetical protein WAT27_14240, partial [Chitinophagales bacterium]